jgi:hypothetical protein
MHNLHGPQDTAQSARECPWARNEPVGVDSASRDGNAPAAEMPARPHRAVLAATALCALATAATLVWLRLVPGIRFDPQDVLPAIVATQVVGALAVVAWLARSSGSAGRG